MKYIFLTDEFYNAHPKKLYPEMIQKHDRPYVQVLLSVKNQLWAIPLRSHINHNYAIWSDKENRCGIDLTKAVPITEDDILSKAQIRENEFQALKGKDYIVVKKFQSFIQKYNHAKQNPNLISSKSILRFSSLQYFEKYLENTYRQPKVKEKSKGMSR